MAEEVASVIEGHQDHDDAADDVDRLEADAFGICFFHRLERLAA